MGAGLRYYLFYQLLVNFVFGAVFRLTVRPYLDVFLFAEKDGATADVRQREKCGEAQERYSVRSRYGLLSAGAGLCNTKMLRHGCRLINNLLRSFDNKLIVFYGSNKSFLYKTIQVFYQIILTNII